MLIILKPISAQNKVVFKKTYKRITPTNRFKTAVVSLKTQPFYYYKFTRITFQSHAFHFLVSQETSDVFKMLYNSFISKFKTLVANPSRKPYREKLKLKFHQNHVKHLW
jgi:hypothetical protein